MLTVDGKVIDITKPETLTSITFKEGGYIEQGKNGVVVRLNAPKEKHDEREKNSLHRN
jgi:hypothetical protein